VLNRPSNTTQQIPIMGTCMRLRHSPRQLADHPSGSGSSTKTPSPTSREDRTKERWDRRFKLDNL
jgi:hypothetical protein